ncbi:hypothetical protein PR048_025042 [Dryococelus australis]|uniref:Secreted protein n=1 Tax=Dryococelus australis TaxID=614101 RepID=A0ABQ9GQA4_9NEOP|nr:hypothetical protein PR048_025042 [Dryococelus australis]
MSALTVLNISVAIHICVTGAWFRTRQETRISDPGSESLDGLATQVAMGQGNRTDHETFRKKYIYFCYVHVHWGRSDVVVRLLASNRSEPGSIPGVVFPGISRVGIAPDDASGRWGFSRGSPVSLTLAFRRFFHARLRSSSQALKTSMLESPLNLSASAPLTLRVNYAHVLHSFSRPASVIRIADDADCRLTNVSVFPRRRKQKQVVASVVVDPPVRRRGGLTLQGVGGSHSFCITTLVPLSPASLSASFSTLPTPGSITRGRLAESRLADSTRSHGTRTSTPDEGECCPGALAVRGAGSSKGCKWRS